MNRQDAEVLDLLSRGYSEEEVLALYPGLTAQDLHRLSSADAEETADMPPSASRSALPGHDPRQARAAAARPRRKRRVVSTAFQAVLIPAVLLVLGIGLMSTLRGVGRTGGGSFVRAEVITKYARPAPEGAPAYFVRTALGDVPVKPGVYSDVQVRRPVCLQLVQDRRRGGGSRVVGVVPDDLCT